MEPEIAIKVENVSKNFLLPHEKNDTIKSAFMATLRGKKNRKIEKQHALKNISLEVKRGEFFGIVGRNGSGKSTLLKILAGIYQPTSGQTQTVGKLVPFIELGVGFNPELTGRDNVYLNGALLGFSKKEIDEKYPKIVEFAELEKFMDQKLKNYSSGMQVRLAFSVAVQAEADILLIDEVLAVGDADFKRKCYDYFRKLKKEKKTVVFVSHDMASVNEYCDRAALIESNLLKDIGPTNRIADEYQELFLVQSQADKNLNKLDDSRRVGSGVARIEAAKLSKAIYSEKDEEIEFTISVKAANTTSQLMAGFSVKNIFGEYINSSHSWQKTSELAKLKVGEKCGVKWSIPNIYEDGTYTIDVYAKGKDNELYDRLDDVLTFKVKRADKSGALVTVKTKMKVD